ncbi:hypothetical protein ONZ51_g12050 [Trametes cubensis]|uniref:Uncharacterized protein n=1 Tax=Trametes cubensis TaxID=1111947 RepID=A0AAD7THB3_9APHY|nr:hypothetical protein ONZ51_g12050 [Trametes cubensis]
MGTYAPPLFFDHDHDHDHRRHTLPPAKYAYYAEYWLLTLTKHSCNASVTEGVVAGDLSSRTMIVPLHRRAVDAPPSPLAFLPGPGSSSSTTASRSCTDGSERISHRIGLRLLYFDVKRAINAPGPSTACPRPPRLCHLLVDLASYTTPLDAGTTILNVRVVLYGPSGRLLVGIAHGTQTDNYARIGASVANTTCVFSAPNIWVAQMCIYVQARRRAKDDMRS